MRGFMPSRRRVATQPPPASHPAGSRARRDRGPRRARAQPRRPITSSMPKRELVVFTGAERLGQVEPRVRHALRRGAAPLRRDAVSAYARQFLGQLERPARRAHPRALADDRHRAEERRVEPALDRRHHHRDLRLPARALRARRRAALHDCGKPVHGAERRARSSREMLALPEGHASSASSRRSSRTARASSASCSRSCARAASCACDVDGADRTRSTIRPTLDKKQSSTRSSSSSIASSSSARPRARLAESVELALREGKGELVVAVDAAAGKAAARSSVQREPRVLRPELPRAQPAELLVQQPARHVPASATASARALEVDPDARRRRRDAVDPRRRDRAVGDRDGARRRLDLPHRRRRRRRRARSTSTRPGRSSRRTSRSRCSTASRARRSRSRWGKRGQREPRHVRACSFEGVIPNLERRYRETTSRSRCASTTASSSRDRPCDACGGKRLRPESLAVRVGGKSIADVTAMTVERALAHFARARARRGAAHDRRGRAARDRQPPPLPAQRRARLPDARSRRARRSRGGEAQRIRLASQLGSELSGVMYVLDEPQHRPAPARQRAARSRRSGTCATSATRVLVVEHDEETIRAADHVVDFGPGAGHLGGKVVFEGTPDASSPRAPRASPARTCPARRRIEVPDDAPRSRRARSRSSARREHNLKNVDVAVPARRLRRASPGVSGAGKSSLVNGILLPGARARSSTTATERGRRAPRDRRASTRSTRSSRSTRSRSAARRARTRARTPRRSTAIREVFAQLPEARARGYDAGRF